MPPHDERTSGTLEGDLQLNFNADHGWSAFVQHAIVVHYSLVLNRCARLPKGESFSSSSTLLE